MMNFQNEVPRVTVFTPTYNRAKLLPDLYSSLVRQSVKDFEWLIVDDGSTDDTELLVNEWKITTTSFSIVYIKKENGGKHTAINEGLNHAKGDYFIIVDSDDYLNENAVEIIINDMALVASSDYAGVGYVKKFEDGSVVGKSFVGEYIDCSSLERGKHGIEGDKAEVFFTSVLKKYPFPVFDGEKFVTEALVWNRIANDGYKLRWLNKSFYICRYQPDGLSLGNKTVKDVNGYTLFIKELIKYNSISFFEKTKWLGVYSDVMRGYKTKLTDISKRVNAPVIWVCVSALVYRVIKRVRQAKRVKRLSSNK